MPRPTSSLRLRGPAGEPVDFWRTVRSHGCATLPPAAVDEHARTLTVTLAAAGHEPRTVALREDPPGQVQVPVALRGPVAHLLRLDEDLSEFYALTADDPELSWAGAGAGRLLRSATVYEDLVKTLCTTNCAWSATERMVAAIVEHLGEPAVQGTGRAFPTPAAMAEAGEGFYRDVARAGYRGAYLLKAARAVAAGELDLEVLGDPDLPDDEVERRLLALPGIGPYAAAHLMLMLGRYSRLILDSWTRPTYAQLAGRRTVNDKTILRRYARYGRWAGLAFWLQLTHGWVEDGPAAPPEKAPG